MPPKHLLRLHLKRPNDALEYHRRIFFIFYREVSLGECPEACPNSVQVARCNRLRGRHVVQNAVKMRENLVQPLLPERLDRGNLCLLSDRPRTAEFSQGDGKAQHGRSSF